MFERFMALLGYKRYVRVEHEDGGWFVGYPKEVEALVAVEDPLGKEAFTFSNVYMRPAEFEALPEFDGF